MSQPDSTMEAEPVTMSMTTTTTTSTPGVNSVEAVETSSVVGPSSTGTSTSNSATGLTPNLSLPVKPVAAVTAPNDASSTSTPASRQPTGGGGRAFKAPSAIPMDLELIMQMVGGAEGGEQAQQAQQAQLAQEAQQVQGSTSEGQQPSATSTAQAVDVDGSSRVGDSSDSDDDDDDDDSSSSSESDSDSDDNAEEGPETMPDSSPELDGDIQLPSTTSGSSTKPMDAATHARLLGQLTSWIGPPVGGSEEDGDDAAVEGYITAESEEEDGEGSAMIIGDGDAEDDDVDMDAMKAVFAAKMAEADDDEEDDSDDDEDVGAAQQAEDIEDVDDDDEDDDAGPSGPPVTKHELPLPPVQPPKIVKLPENERLVLAGEVLSFVMEPGVEGWWRDHNAKKVDKEAHENEAPQGSSTDGDKAGSEVIAAVLESGDALQTPAIAEDSARAPAIPDDSVAGKKPTIENELVMDDIQASAPVEGGKKAADSLTDIQADQTPSQSTPAAETTSAPVASTTETAAKTEAEHGNKQHNKKRRGRKGKAGGSGVGPAGGSHGRWTSSGTIVVRAILDESSQQGSYMEDGWLEEGSLICDAERNVIASIAETFGPLSSPFYLLRLAPPPHPIPSRADLPVGTKLYYPADHDRSFVPVRMLRTDKRFKGTDASNLFDEEVDDDEMEWSDDEQEQKAKAARKKAARAARDGSAAPSQSGSRPRHFDAGGFEDRVLDYERSRGGAPHDTMDTSSVASSSRTNRSRLVAYDDIVGGVPSLPAPPSWAGSERGKGGGGGGGRGRGGRGSPSSDRTNGRPSQSAQRGGRNVGRGFGRGSGQQNARGNTNHAQSAPAQQQQQQQQQRSAPPPPSMPMAMPMQHGPINGGQPGFNFGHNAGMMTGANPYMMMGMQPGFGGAQPGFGMQQPGFGAPMGGMGGGPNGAGGGVVNPRFAAMQYQQMMAMAAAQAQAQMWQHHQQGQGPPQ